MNIKTVSKRMRITINKETKARKFIHLLCPINKIEMVWLNDVYLEWYEYTYNPQFIAISQDLHPNDTIIIEYTD